MSALSEQHDHDHHDHHDHDHHDHDHDGESCSIGDDDGLNIIEHEGALAVSVAKELLGTPQQVESLVDSSLERLVSRVQAQDAVIGHIKAALTCQTPIATYSCVYDSVNKKHHDPRSYRLELTVILFDVTKEELTRIIEDTMLDLSSGMIQ